MTHACSTSPITPNVCACLNKKYTLVLSHPFPALNLSNAELNTLPALAVLPKLKYSVASSVDARMYSTCDFVVSIDIEREGEGGRGKRGAGTLEVPEDTGCVGGGGRARAGGEEHWRAATARGRGKRRQGAAGGGERPLAEGPGRGGHDASSYQSWRVGAICLRRVGTVVGVAHS